jgi:hypothetical protein
VPQSAEHSWDGREGVNAIGDRSYCDLKGHPLCEAKRAGRLNVELASLANAILAYQKKLLAQVELYAAVQAAGAEVPRDPEAFRLWLHRARKQGLVTRSRGGQSKA